MKKILRFRDIEQASYTLIGFIPYLLAIYLVVLLDIEPTPTILLAGMLSLGAHLTGYTLIRRFGKQLTDVYDLTGKAAGSEDKKAIKINRKSPDELTGIIRNFNALMEESTRSNHNFNEVTTKLLIYTREIERYQSRLKDEAVSRSRLSRYVDKSVADMIASSPEDVLLQNVRQEATILFADIRGFTGISEHMRPEAVLDFLSAYFDAMVNIIFSHDGILDKFIGDELMASFGVLGHPDDGPFNAVKAAVAMQLRTRSLMSEFRKKKYPAFEIGIGINTGPVVMGSVGSRNRMDYTVIGDAVNVASRLQEYAEGQSIVVGEETYMRCKARVPMDPRGEVMVRNRLKPVKCYAVKK